MLTEYTQANGPENLKQALEGILRESKEVPKEYFIHYQLGSNHIYLKLDFSQTEKEPILVSYIDAYGRRPPNGIKTILADILPDNCYFIDILKHQFSTINAPFFDGSSSNVILQVRHYTHEDADKLLTQYSRKLFNPETLKAEHLSQYATNQLAAMTEHKTSTLGIFSHKKEDKPANPTPQIQPKPKI